MRIDETGAPLRDENAVTTSTGAGDADDATPGVALPLGTAPLVGASFGAAGGFSPAGAGTAPLAGSAVPLVAPLVAPGASADGETAERVEAALADDGRIARSHSIVVTALGGGVIELAGTAGSPHDSRLAEQIAAHQNGVVAVRNQIRVAPPTAGTL